MNIYKAIGTLLPSLGFQVRVSPGKLNLGLGVAARKRTFTISNGANKAACTVHLAVFPFARMRMQETWVHIAGFA